MAAKAAASLARAPLKGRRLSGLPTGRPLAFFSPHPHVRDAFAQAGIAVFNHEAEALVALQSFIAHRGVLRPVSTAPSPESHHA